MLVDDEPDILRVFKNGLEIHGYSVDAYDSPKDALENFEQSKYDRIVLDIRMPEMNGFDLARALWQKDSNAQVCFFSAFEILEEEANKVFKDLNTKCFLKKPMTPTGLIEHIENHHLNTRA
jgi:DNA-binding response OmpR family regulator